MRTDLGESRTVNASDHAFIAPDGHVHAPHPAWNGAEVITLISPQLGARFSQALVRLSGSAEGGPGRPAVERFLFVLEGTAEIIVGGDSHTLGPYGYAFLPAGADHRVRAPTGEAHLCLFERRYLQLEGVEPPGVILGNERDHPGEAFMGDDALTVRRLLPDEDGFDLAVNTMTFEPGTPLPFVETHVMEHGLLMLEGGGIYRLNRRWYPIQAGDALWMAPYCPQWFGALGKGQAKYLLYKENRRDPFQHERES